MSDVADYFLEDVNISQKTYKVDGKDRNLKVHTEEIKIKGKEPVIFEAYETHRGALISTIPNRSPKGVANVPYMSFAWTGKNPDQLFDVLVERLKINSKEDIIRTMHKFPAPGMTLPYATKNGDIGFIGMGN